MLEEDISYNNKNLDIKEERRLSESPRFYEKFDSFSEFDYQMNEYCVHGNDRQDTTIQMFKKLCQIYIKNLTKPCEKDSLYKFQIMILRNIDAVVDSTKNDMVFEINLVCLSMLQQASKFSNLCEYLYQLLAEKFFEERDPYELLSKCIEAGKVEYGVILISVIEQMAIKNLSFLENFDKSKLLAIWDHFFAENQENFQNQKDDLVIQDIQIGLLLNLIKVFVDKDNSLMTSQISLIFGSQKFLQKYSSVYNIYQQKILQPKISNIENFFIHFNFSIDDIYNSDKHQKTEQTDSENEQDQHNFEFKILKEIALKSLMNNFQVITGPECSGKSYYLKRLFNLTQSQSTSPQSLENSLFEHQLPNVLSNKFSRNIIRIYLDENIDIKGLMGNYICTEKIGEFKWVDGPITYAYKYGLTLILENQNLANDDLINLFYEMSQGKFYLQGKFFSKGKGFNIIATWTTSQTGNAKFKNCYKQFFNGLNFVDITNLKIEDIDGLLNNQWSKYWHDLGCCGLLSDFIRNIYYEIVRLGKYRSRKFDMNKRKAIYFLDRCVYQKQQFYPKASSGSGNSDKISYQSETFKKRILLEAFDVFINAERVDNETNPIVLNFDFESLAQINKNEFVTFWDSYTADLSIRGNVLNSFRYDNIQISLESDKSDCDSVQAHPQNIFARTGQVSKLMEQILSCVLFGQMPLLVGETGCGKTTCCQEMAKLLNKKLHVYNLSQSSDVNDLLGGFRPQNLSTYLEKIYSKLIKIQKIVSNLEVNRPFLANLTNLLRGKRYYLYIKCVLKGLEAVSGKITDEFENNELLKDKVSKLQSVLRNLVGLKDKLENQLIFSYIKGNLIDALKKGDWVLLDEVNLAEGEVLQKLMPIFEGESIIQIERGKIEEVKRHEDFRLLGCMNPGNDVARKELPDCINNKFIEIYVKELEKTEELINIVEKQLEGQQTSEFIAKIVHIYLKIRNLASQNQLQDGFGRKPQFSQRTLSRCCAMLNNSIKLYGNSGNSKFRAIYDSIACAFGCGLSQISKKDLHKIFIEIFQFGTDQEIQNYYKSQTGTIQNEACLQIKGFCVKKGDSAPQIPENETDYLLTGKVEKNLIELQRVVAHSDFPILLEGPTSCGKTAVVKFLAEITGHRVVRINNHQHTDLEEYIGTYCPDSAGKLSFKEGQLVEAMRNGYWLILDELNQAKSEILEAQNRVLDDNRELLISEINCIVKPHKNFRIFATQNPISYGGRKALSKAFRNRFMHFYFEDLTDQDLIKILEKRCELPQSRAKLQVAIMKELQLIRSQQNVFAGKESVITIRDLLKWGKRPCDSKEDLSIQGYCLLAERLRNSNEREWVSSILQKLTSVEIRLVNYYHNYCHETIQGYKTLLVDELGLKVYKEVSYSDSFCRMWTLVDKGQLQKEPVQLIGETGCGKTTIAQVFAELKGLEFYSVNCHQHTESSDFLGSLRPVRGKHLIVKSIEESMNMILSVLLASHVNIEQQNFDQEFCNLIDNARAGKELLADSQASFTKKREFLRNLLNSFTKFSGFFDIVNYQNIEDLLKKIYSSIEKLEMIFEWVDGPLIKCMKYGGVLLIDEISLAQDSVLERQNSVLESDRKILLSEKGDSSTEEITAHKDCYIIATMNPSGDFGKKELTPALRNRFTEIWVEPATCVAKLLANKNFLLMKNCESWENLDLLITENDLYEQLFDMFAKFDLKIAQDFFTANYSTSGDCSSERLQKFLCYIIYTIVSEFNINYGQELKPITLRDIKYCIGFMINQFQKTYYTKFEKIAYETIELLLEGQFCINFEAAEKAKHELVEFINRKIEVFVGKCDNHTSKKISAQENVIADNETLFGIEGYCHSKNPENYKTLQTIKNYSINEPTIKENMRKQLRALELERSIIMEGQPGVGKTSLIEKLAEILGVKLYRVNLSEQTDLIDLLGSDVPVEGSSLFEWADGLLLKAMKEGAWFMLDELNLASQSVLEGLNSILDHRGAIYLTELDRVVVKNPGFRLFGSQNPMTMGAGRKGLPYSFLSRFSRIWLSTLPDVSLKKIITSIYNIGVGDNLAENDLEGEKIKLVDYFFEVKKIIEEKVGLVWEFNQRDLHRIFEYLNSQDLTFDKFIAEVDYICDIIIHKRLHDQELCAILKSKFYEKFGRKIGHQHRNLTIEDEFVQTKAPEHQQSQEDSNCVENNMKIIASNYHYIEEPIYRDFLRQLPTKWPILFILKENCEFSDIVSPYYIIENLSKIFSKEQNCSINFYKIDLFKTTDISDLLGSFEQTNFYNKLGNYVHELKVYLGAGFQGQFSSGDAQTRMKKLIEAMLNIEFLIKNESSLKNIYSKLQNIVNLIGESFFIDNPILSINSVDIYKKFEAVFEKQKFIQKEAENLIQKSAITSNDPHDSNGQDGAANMFEWIDSLQCKAIENGYWIYLKGCHTANPAILERLNSLLESGDVIYLSEALTSTNEPRILKKSKNFRIFLEFTSEDVTANIPFSRALRNRCVEINWINYIDNLPNMNPSHFVQNLLDSNLAKDDQELSSTIKNERMIWFQFYFMNSGTLFTQDTEQIMAVLQKLLNCYTTSEIFTQIISQKSTWLNSIYNFYPLKNKFIENLQTFHNNKIEDEISENALFGDGNTYQAFLEIFQKFLSSEKSQNQNADLHAWVVQNWFKVIIGLLSTNKQHPMVRHESGQNPPKDNFMTFIEILLKIINGCDISKILLNEKFEGIIETISNNYKMNTKENFVQKLQKFYNTKNYNGQIILLNLYSYFSGINGLHYIDNYVKFINSLDTDPKNQYEFLKTQENELSGQIKSDYAIRNNFKGFVSIINHLLISKKNVTGKYVKFNNHQQNFSNKDQNEFAVVLNKIFSEKSVLALQILDRSNHSESDKIIQVFKTILSQSTENFSLADKKDSFCKILTELCQNIENGLELVFNKLQNCFILFEDVDPYDDTLTTKKIVLKNNDRSDIQFFIAALSMKEDLQNFEIYGLFELLEDKYERSEYLSGQTYSLKQVFKKDSERGLDVMYDIRCKLDQQDLKILECFFINFGYYQKKNELVKLIQQFCQKFKSIKNGALINEISIISEMNVIQSEMTIIKNIAVENLSQDSLDDFENSQNYKQNMIYLKSYIKNVDAFDNTKIIDNLKELVEQETSFIDFLNKSVNAKVFVSLLSENSKSNLMKIIAQIEDFKNLLKDKKLRSVKLDNELMGDANCLENQNQMNPEMNFSYEAMIRHFLDSYYEESDYRISEMTMSCIDEIIQAQDSGSSSEKFFEKTCNLFEEVLNNGEIIFFSDILIPFIRNSYLYYISLKNDAIHRNNDESKMDIEDFDNTEKFDLLFDDHTFFVKNLKSYKKSDYESIIAILNYFNNSDKQVFGEFDNKYERSLENSQIHYYDDVKDREKLGKGRAVDEVSKIQNLEKALERIIIDEYTKIAVDQQKFKERLEIQQQFGYTAEDDLNEQQKSLSKLKTNLNKVSRKLLKRIFPQDQTSEESNKLTNSSTYKFIKVLMNFIQLAPESLQLKQPLDLLSGVTTGILTTMTQNLIEPKILTTDLMKLFTKTGFGKKDKQIYDQKSAFDIQDSSISKIQNELKFEKLSFYNGKNITEIVELNNMIISLTKKLSKIRENVEQTDQPIIANIQSLSQFILSQKIEDMPLNKAAGSVTQLITYQMDYETIVPTMWHLSEHKQLLNTMKRWRDIERRSWRVLINKEINKIRLEDLPLFIKMKRIAMDYINSEYLSEKEMLGKVFTLFDEYIRRSTFATFEMRLSLLLTFSRSCPRIQQNSRQNSQIKHIIKFYTSFWPTFKKSYDGQLESVNQPIKDVEKLSNWNRVDMVNLKININHFHKGVNRALKMALELAETSIEIQVLAGRRRDYLGENIECLLANLKSTGIEKEYFTEGEVESRNYQTAKKIGEIVKKWKEINLRSEITDKGFDQIEKLIRASRIVPPTKMLEMLNLEGADSSQESLNYKNYATAIDYCDYFTKDWGVRLQQLKDEKSNSVKERAFVDFLKIMKSFGVKDTGNLANWDMNDWLGKSEIVDVQDLKLLTSDIGLGIGYLEKQLKVERRFYLTVDHQIVMRSEINYTKEIPSHFVQRGQGVMVSQIDIFRISYVRVSKILQATEGLYQDITKKFYRKNLLDDLQLENLVALGGKLGKLESLIQVGWDNDNAIATNLKACMEKFMTSQNQEFDQELLQMLEDFESWLIIYSQKNEDCENFVRELAKLTSQVKSQYKLHLNSMETENPEIFNPEKTDLQKKKIERLIKEILSVEAKYDKELNDNDCFVIPEFHFLSSIESLIRGFSTQIKRLQIDRLAFEKQKNSIEFTHIFSILKVLSAHSIDWLYSLNRLQYMVSNVVYNIIYKGFCKVDNQDENNDDNKSDDNDYDFTDGTGIGEGKGKENVSKEIEFEEQVLGLKDDQENDDQSEDDKDDQEDQEKKDKDEIDMDNDFQGKNEEKKDGEAEDEDEKKKDEDDIKDEIDSVNDDELDKKLWDDEKAENEEEEKDEEDEEKSMRSADDVDYQGQEPKNDEQKEMKAKDIDNEKETRQAEDFKDINVDDEDKDDKDDKDEDKKDEGDDGEDEEMADVEERSEMSDRENKDEVDFRSQAEEEQSKQGSEIDEEDKENSHMNEEEDKIDDDDDEDNDNNSEFEDPLNQKERKFEEEKPEEEVQDNKEDQEGLQGQDGEEAKEDDKNKQPDKKNKEDKTRGTDKNLGNDAMSEDGLSDGDEDDQDAMDEERVDKANKEEKEAEAEAEDDTQKKNFKKEDLVSEDILKKFMSDLKISDEADQDDQDGGGDDQDLDMGDIREVEVCKDPNQASFMTNAPGRSSDVNKNNLDKEDDDNDNLRKNQPQMNEEIAGDNNLEDDQDKGSDKDKIENELPEEDLEKNVDDKKKKKDKKDKEDNLTKKRDFEEITDSDDSENSNELQKEFELEQQQAIKKQKIPEEDLVIDNNQFSLEDLNEYANLLKTDESQQPKENPNKKGKENLWKKYENELRDQAYTLSEELRSVLQPTRIAGLKGDFKSGKRLNMRKVISFVASNYRKDKIWLRRSDPSQRDYQILLAIDDTSSMSEQNVGPLALQALTTLALALTKLEVGQIGIAAIRNQQEQFHPFERTFIASDGSKLIDNFGFRFTHQLSADLGMANFMKQSINLFSKDDKKKICFILSDGRFNKSYVRPLCQEAEEKDLLYVFIILDKMDSKNSILNCKTSNVLKEDGKIKIDIQNYLDDFPFKNYIIVKSVGELLSTVVGILRNYFEMEE